MRPEINVPSAISVEFETNGLGWIGYTAELPGAFVRGRTEDQCQAKIDAEIRRYCQWLGLQDNDSYDVSVAQVRQSQLRVEDADNEILLHYDQRDFSGDTFEVWSEIARFSAECFQRLYDSTTLRDWRDPTRERETFYGKCPSSIQEVYAHVDRVQGYYQQCLGLESALCSRNFPERRGECLARIAELHGKHGNKVRFLAGEEWTIAKALRRYIWHDHIHAKSIVRTLHRQVQENLIQEFIDPFTFGGLSTDARSDLA